MDFMSKKDFQNLQNERKERIGKAVASGFEMRRNSAYFPKNPKFWGRYTVEFRVATKICDEAREHLRDLYSENIRGPMYLGVEDEVEEFRASMLKLWQLLKYCEQCRKEDAEEVTRRLEEKAAGEAV